MRYLRFIVAFALCAPALVMPYRLRVAYGQTLAWIFHLPPTLFGRLARRLMRELETPNPYGPAR